ncbi:hypothetical protein BOO92_04240 [Vibrio navarrensis]|uniref:YbcC family protein n=1 Tax=Vibrio navarrensis TaxID=29495 RepID=UPI0018670BAF|nr:DUF2309 domain-containing protein [Vibrio navarrensis]MBE3655909.1 hypothetical protein [Vibrio navarrensis]
MTAQLRDERDFTALLHSAISSACNSIAPNWPLDRMIAVNPYWSWVDKPFNQVAHHLAKLAGSPLAMPLAYYRQLWESGAISAQDLSHALTSPCFAQEWNRERALTALNGNDEFSSPAPLLCDTLDSQRNLLKQPAWCDTVTHQIAQFCAAYFDQDQADWHPHSDIGLYQSWRETLRHDHSVALLMKAPHIPALANQMALDAQEQIRQALTQLNIAPEHWHDYLQALMYRVSGWGAWCAYLKWQANLSQQEENSLVDLLAIRLSWECLVDDKARHSGSVWQRWQQQWQQHFQQYDPRKSEVRLIWQRAHELSYQRQLCQQLALPVTKVSSQPSVQAAFCIDVRSEVIRRHLEAQSDQIATLGFAGFFGLPISYDPIGTQIKRPQLPGLLAPSVSVCDSSGCAEQDAKIAKQREQALERETGWSMFQRMPASTFTLVEALGLGYVGKLVKRALPLTAKRKNAAMPGLSLANTKQLRPTLFADTEQQVMLAENALKGMGLTEYLAPIVLLVGHGSETANNPQRAGLDCGACCGQTGEVNARALAQILNQQAVREGLSQRGVVIPDSTHFVAALHNTTTEALRLFDIGSLDDPTKKQLSELQATLDAASSSASAERVPQIGLKADSNQPSKVAKEMERRSVDWAQTRPEWGLANNAAFIIAPRERTRGIPLHGRTFLHEYCSEADLDATLLAQIMTAPMVVTNWINMQYYASTVDPRRYGSGNKTLHNVVGGRLGVFEGNGGDLRIGLSLQSLHDGSRWRHEPLRLTVVIDAPEKAIESVIRQHAIVRQLVENQWLYLARFEQEGLAFFEQGRWERRSLN